MAANVSVSWSPGPHPNILRSRGLLFPKGRLGPFCLSASRPCGRSPVSLFMPCLCLPVTSPSVPTPFVRILRSVSSWGRVCGGKETQEVLPLHWDLLNTRRLPAALPFIPSFRLGPWNFQMCRLRELDEASERGVSLQQGWGSRYRPGGAVQQRTDRAVPTGRELPALGCMRTAAMMQRGTG